MVRNQWLDLDLDFLNDHERPIEAIKRIIKGVSPKVPCAIVVEHHETLPHVRRALRTGQLMAPMSIFHVDEHHDYYGGDRTRPLYDPPDCGDYLYYVDPKKYQHCWWVRPKRWDSWIAVDWDEARDTMREVGVKLEQTRRFNWNPKKVGLLTVALSPDYISLKLAAHIPMIFKLLEQRFRPQTVVRKKKRTPYSHYCPASWRKVKRAESARYPLEKCLRPNSNNEDK